MTRWTSFSKLLILQVIFHSFLRLRCYLTAAACSVSVVLLRVDDVGRINCNMHVLDLVDVLDLLAAGEATLVRDRVLPAGALSLTVGMACACCLLWSFVFLVIWWLSGRSPCTTFGVLSTLGNAVGDTLGTSGVSFVIELVSRLSVSSNDCITFTSESECNAIVRRYC